MNNNILCLYCKSNINLSCVANEIRKNFSAYCNENIELLQVIVTCCKCEKDTTVEIEIIKKTSYTINFKPVGESKLIGELE